MEIVCDVCGNSIASSSPVCPFCGNKIGVADLKKPAGYVHNIVNLEAGRPVVAVALTRLLQIIEDSARNHINVLTLIHGYGSSGKGGAIRMECRKTLDFLKSQGKISDYIAGEDFSKRSRIVKSLISRYPQLGADKHLNKGNPGITLVLFSYGLLLLPVLPTIYNATLWS